MSADKNFSTRHHLAFEWAREQPSYSWLQLPILPRCGYQSDVLYAVKTDTGKILTGTFKAFRPTSMERIEPSYGKVLYWLRCPESAYSKSRVTT